MLKDIVSVTPLSDYRLKLVFEDGVTGNVAVKAIVEFNGVFERLNDPAFFKQVSVVPDLGTIAWPNGADLDPDVLYGIISGEEQTIVIKD